LGEIDNFLIFIQESHLMDRPTRYMYDKNCAKISGKKRQTKNAQQIN
jgi:hypothetical protein